MPTQIEWPSTKPAMGARESEESTPPKLLVVDDSEFERRFIARLIADFPGLRVGFAPGGAEALEVVRRDAPDLILTDLVMPGVDGLELVRQVREARPGLPIILMTAFGGENEAVGALRAGAVDYLPKSRLERDLAPTLRRALDVFRIDRRRSRLNQRLRSRTSEYELDCDPRMIWALGHMLVEEVAGLGLLDPSGQVRLHVALQEALANALYHGNLEMDSALRQGDETEFYDLAEARRGQDPYRSRRIRVRASVDRRAAVFEIADDGAGFDPSLAERATEAQELTRIGGRGLLLMRTFMDELAYNAKGNAVTLTKRFAPARSAR